MHNIIANGGRHLLADRNKAGVLRSVNLNSETIMQ